VLCTPSTISSGMVLVVTGRPYTILSQGMDTISTVKMDKTAFSVASLTDEPDEKAYWMTKTPQERLEVVELLRQLNYGYDPATARLQRVLAVVEFKGR
jgi:hypothetical protein